MKNKVIHPFLKTLGDTFLRIMENSAAAIQWVPGAISLGAKWPGREADHSPPKNEWSYTSILPLRLHGVVLS